MMATSGKMGSLPDEAVCFRSQPIIFRWRSGISKINRYILIINDRYLRGLEIYRYMEEVCQDWVISENDFMLSAFLTSKKERRKQRNDIHI